MHPKTKNRIITSSIIFLIISIGISLVLYNLSSNISFFVTPTELLAKPNYNYIKLGGYAKKDSIVRISIDEVRFIVTDRINEIEVHYKGAVPGIFRDDQGVVISGYFQKDGSFAGTELFAKHDEKYMPKSAKDKMNNGNTK